MYHAWSCHFVCGVILLLVFMVFFWFASYSYLFVLEGLGNWLGKGKVNGA